MSEVWEVWSAQLAAPDGTVHGEQFSFKVEIDGLQRKNLADA